MYNMLLLVLVFVAKVMNCVVVIGALVCIPRSLCLQRVPAQIPVSFMECNVRMYGDETKSNEITFRNKVKANRIRRSGSSVGKATELPGWTVRGSNPGGEEIFRTCPDRPWGPPSLLYNGYRVFPGGKERPGRDSEPSLPSSAVDKKE